MKTVTEVARRAIRTITYIVRMVTTAFRGKAVDRVGRFYTGRIAELMF